MLKVLAEYEPNDFLRGWIFVVKILDVSPPLNCGSPGTASMALPKIHSMQIPAVNLWSKRYRQCMTYVSFIGSHSDLFRQFCLAAAYHSSIGKRTQRIVSDKKVPCAPEFHLERNCQLERIHGCI